VSALTETGPDLCDTELRAIVLAILHHHTGFTQVNMSPDAETVGSISASDFDDEFLSSVSAAGFPKLGVTQQQLEGFRTELDHVRQGSSGIKNRQLGLLTTILYSVLRQVDQHVSAGGDPELAIESLTSEDVTLFDALRPFQRQVQNELSPRMMGIAGCGEGKTHTALQWGSHLLEQDQIDRLVFAMPTQVTTNNLLLTLTGSTDGADIEHVPPEKAGLHHGASSAFYSTADYDGSGTTSAVRNARARRWFQKPVTVTTVDHILATLVNGYNGSSVARGNLLRAGIVFDELHTYDTKLIERIIGSIDRLTEFGVPWYVMTATLPQSIESHTRLDPDVTHVSSGRLREGEPKRTPFRIDVEPSELTVDDVRAHAKIVGANTVMVVKNTVREAQEIALALNDDPDTRVIYYSSEFPSVDRGPKEQQIRRELHAEASPQKTTYLVSTQVSEISLDLSADLLLTDIAPMDAILQRGGRMHRRGVRATPEDCRKASNHCPQCRRPSSPTEYRCVVFSPLSDPGTSSWLPYASDDEGSAWDRLERTQDVLKEANEYDFESSRRWMFEVYRDLEIGTGSRFRRAIDQDTLYGQPRAVYGESQNGEPLPIRDIVPYRIGAFPTEYTLHDGRTVTPEEAWHEFHDCSYRTCRLSDEDWSSCVEEFNIFRQQYEVPVPAWWFNADEAPISPDRQLAINGSDIPGTRQVREGYEFEFGISV
jgi:CRISPR-associated helicase Cas3